MSQIQRNVGWVGERPFDVYLAPLKSVLRIRREINSPIKSERILSLTNDRGVIPYEEKGAIGNNVSEDISRYSLVHIGDIVMNSMNVIIGSVGLSKYEGALSPVYYVLQPVNGDQMDMRYFAYHFGMPTFYKQLARIGYGILEHRMRIPWINLQNELMFVPPVAKQKTIADYLDRETTHIDRLINKKRRMIELLNERMRVTVETIIKGDFTSPYPVVPLRHIARFNYGDSLAAEDRIEGDVLVYGSNGPVGTHVSSNTSTPVLVVGRKGSYGKVQYCADGVFAIDTTYYIDRSSCSQNLRWLYFALQTVGLDTLSQDVGIPGLSRESAYRVKVPLPEASRQSEIANELDTKLRHFESLVGAITQEIDLLVERRQVLITAAITGELEIPEVTA